MRASIFTLVLVGCGNSPAKTGTVCPSPDPVTIAYSTATVPTCTGSTDDGDCGFGKRFMDKYCIVCHTSKLRRAADRNGAPLYHDFDTLEGVLEVPDHIDEQTGWGPNAKNDFMPGAGTNGKCPSVAGGPLDKACDVPTDEERDKLALWIACERERTHDLRPDAGVAVDAVGIDAP